MKRDNIAASEAREWIKKQMPQEEVAQRSDFVIENDGRANIEQQINKIISKLTD
jgi:dephospho-CoA kinase